MEPEKKKLSTSTCRDFLKRIDFAGEVFHTPEEIAFFDTEGCTITIQRFIPQECPLLDPIAEQFSLALRAFKGRRVRTPPLQNIVTR